jgi:transposase
VKKSGSGMNNADKEKRRAESNAKERAMRKQPPGEQEAAQERPCHSAKAQPPGVGPSACQPAPSPRPAPDLSAQPRLHVPDRQQPLSALTIDDLLEPGHPARSVWDYVLALDLSALYDQIRARGSRAGRPAIDPRLLVGLWLYATLAGFTSAREIADLCAHHDAFRWLCGGVSVNHHSLSDFRTDNLEFLEQLLKQSVEVLREQGLTDLGRIAQDGLRVRASAGAASFRRRATLEELLQQARDEIRRLKRERAESATQPTASQEVGSGQGPGGGPGPSRQEQAAARRQARERLERVEAALERMPEMEAKIKPGEDREARVSTTDPEATVMKMADGGFRPAYNVAYATACQGQVIVGVDVVTTGSDHGQLPGMLDQIEGRFEERPKEALVDGGFAKLQDIEQVQGGAKGCKVYAPVAKPKKAGLDRHQRKASDSEEVAEWRQRMGTAEAREVYKQRGATAECVNAQARNRGLRLLLVRGTEKVKAVGLWFAIAHNMARSFSLQPRPPTLACS